MTLRHRSVTWRHELSVTTTRFRSMADAIGSSATALKWACAASRSESNGVLTVVWPRAFAACIWISRFVLQTSKSQSLRRPASPFARITTEGDAVPGCAITLSVLPSLCGKPFANRTATADMERRANPARRSSHLQSKTSARELTTVMPQLKKPFVDGRALPITYGAVRRIGLGHPLRRDPARVPQHNTYIRRTRRSKPDISTPLRTGPFYFAPTAEYADVSQRRRNVLMARSRNVLLTDSDLDGRGQIRDEPEGAGPIEGSARGW